MQHSTKIIVLKANNYEFFFLHSIKMLNISLKELILIAKNRNLNGYESMLEDKLLGIINYFFETMHFSFF